MPGGPAGAVPQDHFWEPHAAREEEGDGPPPLVYYPPGWERGDDPPPFEDDSDDDGGPPPLVAATARTVSATFDTSPEVESAATLEDDERRSRQVMALKMCRGVENKVMTMLKSENLDW